MDPIAAPEPMPVPVADAAPVEVVVQPQPLPRTRTPNTQKARDEMLVMMVWIFGAVVVIGMVMTILKVWFRRSTLDDTAGARLSSFRDMLENGEISQEEYDRIMQKMAAKIKGKAGVVPSPVPAKPALPQSPETEPPAATSDDSPAK